MRTHSGGPFNGKGTYHELEKRGREMELGIYSSPVLRCLYRNKRVLLMILTALGISGIALSRQGHEEEMHSDTNIPTNVPAQISHSIATILSDSGEQE